MRNYLIALLCLLLSACASKLGQLNMAAWSHVAVGMTRAQVLEQLGPPRSSTARQEFEVLEYVEERGVFIAKNTGIVKRYEVQLVNGHVTAYGPAAELPPLPTVQRERPSLAVVANKYADWSTAKLQLRRQQLAQAIPDTVVKVGLLAPDFARERAEKEDIEMELLRRFEAGDSAAELKPLPRDDHFKARGGNF